VRPISGGAIGNSLCRKLCADPDWLTQAKLDGKRVLWDGRKLWSSHGNQLHLPTVTDGLPGGWTLDGELVGGTVYWFDIAMPGSLRHRLAVLEESGVRLIPTPGCWVHAWQQADQHSWEGIVCKRLDSTYPRGHRPRTTTPSWVKFK
jgi:ATP-dependent DNA ligase